MVHPIERKQAYTFEEMYDKHSPLLYGIILKISRTTKQSEEILVQSFKTFFLHHLKTTNDDGIFIQLLRIAISIASEKNNLPTQNIGKLILKELNQKQPATPGVRYIHEPNHSWLPE